MNVSLGERTALSGAAGALFLILDNVLPVSYLCLIPMHTLANDH